MKDSAKPYLKGAYHFRSLDSRPTVLTDTLRDRDRENLYYFRLDHRSSITTQMTRLQGDADLDVEIYRLKKAKAATLQKIGKINFSDLTVRARQRFLSRAVRSHHDGHAYEKIVKTLGPGHYYIRINSQGDESTYRLAIAANSRPEIATRQTLSLGKGASATLNRQLLHAVDREQGPSRLHYTLTAMPQNGALFLSGVPLNVGDRFTQAEIDQGALTYTSFPDLVQITHTPGYETLKGFAGNKVVWEASDGHDAEIFIYDPVRQTSTQLTHNDFDDRVVGMSGPNIVWSSLLSPKDGDSSLPYVKIENELFWFDGTRTRNLTNTGTAYDQFVSIQGSKIVWSSLIGPQEAVSYPLNTGELFYFDGKTSRQLTHNDVNEYVNAFDGKHILWMSHNSPTSTIFDLFYFDGKTTAQITQNTVDDRDAVLDAPRRAWLSDIGTANEHGPTSEVLFYDGQTQRRLTRNARDEDMQAIAGSNVVWSSAGGPPNADGYPTSELYLFNGTTTVNLTSNAGHDYFIGMDGANVFWTSYIGPPGNHLDATPELFWYDGRATTRLTNNAADEAVWDRRGSQLAWTSQIGPLYPGGFQTRELFYFDGISTVQVTQNSGDDAGARITDFGLVWVGETGALEPWGLPNQEIWVRDRATGENRQITNNAFGDRNPYASGSTLAWTGEVELGNTDIFMGNVARSDQFKFTVTDGWGGSRSGTFNIEFSG